MGATRQASSLGGLQTNRGALGNATPNREGPAQGGLLVIPFVQKIAGAGAFATQSSYTALTATRLIAAIYGPFLSGAPADVIIQSPTGFTLCPPTGSPATAGDRVAHKEGAGITATDFPWNPSSGAQFEEAGRSIPRGTVLLMSENGAGSVALGTAIFCLVCTRGPVYDSDNPSSSAPFNDPRYYSSKD